VILEFGICFLEFLHAKDRRRTQSRYCNLDFGICFSEFSLPIDLATGTGGIGKGIRNWELGFGDIEIS
jgi:hypothetical protein